MKLFKTLLAGAAIAVGLTGAASAGEKLKVGFIYVGPTGDFGWSYEHDQGRLAIEAALGDKVETTYVESVPESADSERVMTQMALSGTDLIFATSFNYMDHVLNVA
ncbi:MAG: BMP family ABC transporter substrate-binding protein, partial [Proteobacteria bacterium]|nr:BMP family ABC transporter substrate-binding protein [Pseudomonadota bacterium]